MKSLTIKKCYMKIERDIIKLGNSFSELKKKFRKLLMNMIPKNVQDTTLLVVFRNLTVKDNKYKTLNLWVLKLDKICVQPTMS